MRKQLLILALLCDLLGACCLASQKEEKGTSPPLSSNIQEIRESAFLLLTGLCLMDRDNVSPRVMSDLLELIGENGQSDLQLLESKNLVIQKDACAYTVPDAVFVEMMRAASPETLKRAACTDAQMLLRQFPEIIGCAKDVMRRDLSLMKHLGFLLRQHIDKLAPETSLALGLRYCLILEFIHEKEDRDQLLAYMKAQLQTGEVRDPYLIAVFHQIYGRRLAERGLDQLAVASWEKAEEAFREVGASKGYVEYCALLVFDLGGFLFDRRDFEGVRAVLQRAKDLRDWQDEPDLLEGINLLTKLSAH